MPPPVQQAGNIHAPSWQPTSRAVLQLLLRKTVRKTETENRKTGKQENRKTGKGKQDTHNFLEHGKGRKTKGKQEKENRTPIIFWNMKRAEKQKTRREQEENKTPINSRLRKWVSEFYC